MEEIKKLKIDLLFVEALVKKILNVPIEDMPNFEKNDRQFDLECLLYYLEEDAKLIRGILKTYCYDKPHL